MQRRTDRQTHRRAWPLYISRRLLLTRKVTRQRRQRHRDWPLTIDTRPWHDACLRHSITTRSLQWRWALIPQSSKQTTQKQRTANIPLFLVYLSHRTELVTAGANRAYPTRRHLWLAVGLSSRYTKCLTLYSSFKLGDLDVLAVSHVCRVEQFT